MGLDLIDLGMQLEKKFQIEFDRDEYQTAFCGTAGSLCDFVWRKLHGVEPALLDVRGLYDRIHRVLMAAPGRPWWYRGTRLQRILGQHDLAGAWDWLQRTLAVSLPPLIPDALTGRLRVPEQCTTAYRLMHWMSEHNPDRVNWLKQATSTGLPPGNERITPEECWLRVREVLADVLAIEPDKVVPEAHLIEDLGMN